jgi:hypothetical protein
MTKRRRRTKAQVEQLRAPSNLPRPIPPEVSFETGQTVLSISTRAPALNFSSSVGGPLHERKKEHLWEHIKGHPSAMRKVIDAEKAKRVSGGRAGAEMALEIYRASTYGKAQAQRLTS